MAFRSYVDVENILTNIREKRFALAISRDGVVFEGLGLIVVESVLLEDLRSNNEVIGGTLQGYRFAMTVVVPNQSVFNDNLQVNDREEISKGRWFFQLVDVDTNWVRILPKPVALDVVEQNFEGARISLSIITDDIEWIKHRSPTAPDVVSPVLVTSSTLPVPLSESIVSNAFDFQLANPALNPAIANNVRYDLFLYTDEARTNLLWSALNLTKANVIDNPFSSTALASVIERGRLYYGIARCKLGIATADTFFRILVRFETPDFIPPTPAQNDIISFSNTLVDLRVQRGISNTLAVNADFEIKRVSLSLTTTNTANYNAVGEAQTTITLSTLSDEDVYEVRVRSRNAVAISDWSAVRSFTAQAFRGLPIIANFQSNRTKIATGDLTALPFQQVVLTITVIAKDFFAGNLRVRLLDVTSSPLLIQEQVWNSPAFDAVQTFVFTDNPTATKSYRVDVVNVNNQTVSSSVITINEVQLITSELYAHFTAREGLFNDTAATIVANANNKVARWNARVSQLPNYHLLNSNASTQPFKRLNPSGVPFVSFENNLSHLTQPISQVALPSETPFTCYVLALANVDFFPSACVLLLKNINVVQNTFLGIRHSEVAIRYLNTSNADVVTSVFNAGSLGSPFVFVLSFKRTGNSGTFVAGRRNFPSNIYNTLNLTNMKDPNSIVISQLVLNGNLFRVVPDATARGYSTLLIYDILLYTAEHSAAERDQVLEWIATANNL